MIVEALLKRVQVARCADALQRRDALAIDQRQRQQARKDGLAVDEHGAAAAAALPAAGLGGMQVQLLAQRGSQRGQRFGRQRSGFAVELEGDGDRIIQFAFPSI
jgi:hypothetical protein